MQKNSNNSGNSVIEKQKTNNKSQYSKNLNDIEKGKWDIPDEIAVYNPFKKHFKNYIESDFSLTFIQDINISTRTFIPNKFATSYILKNNNQISSIIVIYDSNFNIIYESNIYNGYNFNHISASPNKSYVALFSDVAYDDGEDPISDAEILFIDFKGIPIEISEEVQDALPIAPGKFNEQDIYIYNNNILFAFDIESKCYWLGENKNPIKVEILNKEIILYQPNSNKKINLVVPLEKNCY